MDEGCDEHGEEADREQEQEGMEVEEGRDADRGQRRQQREEEGAGEMECQQ